MCAAVVPHSTFDSLLDAVTGPWIGRSPSLEPQPVVVPSLPFADHLQLRIADRLGVCMGLEFLRPQDFIFRAMGRPPRDEWSKAALMWRIYPHMADFVGRLGAEMASSRDRFAMAGLLADRFDQYAHFRPEIVRRWSVGRFALEETAREDEEWQRELWGRLVGEAMSPHPAVVLERASGDAQARRRLAEKFPRLLVLGSGVIDPLLVEILAVLADAGAEIEAHIVLPSLEYLGDLRRRRALPPSETPPEEAGVAGAHPLLESMGRHAVGAFLLLGRLDDQYTHWPEPAGSEGGMGSLLQRLQADVRELRNPSAVPPDTDDASVRIHACFGPRREMETVRDEILRAFTELEDLRPEEVHIVTPSLDIYAPLVASVLEQGGAPLPVRLLELPPSAREPAIEALLALLDMAREGTFEASALLELTRLDAVQTALGISEGDSGSERVRDWIRRSGLTRGLRGDGEPGTWEFARDRLVADRWLGWDEEGTYPDGNFVLPVSEALGGEQALRARFVGWHFALESALREWQIPAPPQEWASRFVRASAEIFGASEDAALEIREPVQILREAPCATPVDAGAILDWLDAQSREAGRRTQASGRIAFGQFKQLQNIPCRVLAMVGMQDGAFPSAGRSPAWDLLRRDPRAWDRDARVDDRQLFLDALLAPRERLVITASTRNLRTRKSEPFSSCVDELLRVAAAMGRDRASLVVEHRLQPFAADYFSPAHGLPRSFSEDFAEVARELKDGREAAVQTFWDDSQPPPPIERVTLRELAAFWRDPARAFLAAQGVALPEEAEDDADLDRFPMSPDGLGRWTLEDAIVKAVASGNRDLAGVEARLRADRCLPPGDLGTAVWAEGRSTAEALGRSIREHAGPSEPLELTLPFGVQLVGEISLTASGGRLFAARPGKMDKPRHLLEPWIHAVAAACAGRPAPTWILDRDHCEHPRELPPIPAGTAQEILASLIEGFAAGHVRPLAYAPAASDVCAKTLTAGTPESALAAAATDYLREPTGYGIAGEGTAPACRIAWRDRDPFENAEEWLRWTRAVAAPLREWGGFK